MNPNNVVIKSTLPRSASSADKLNEIINQLQQKYHGRAIYTLAEIKKENKEVNFDTVSKWSKEVNGVTLSDFLLSIGILSPIQYFDVVEKDVLVENLKGKKCCAFNYDGTIFTLLQDLMAKCGAIIVPPDANEIDYVWGSGLLQLSKIPQDNRNDVYSVFDRRDKGELSFEVLPYDFRYKVESYIFERDVKNRLLTQEERTALGISTYNQPQEIIFDYGYTIKNNIKLEDIPQYDTNKHYWSLSYFYNWYDASSGEIRLPLDSYCIEGSEDPANIIKRNFDVFSSLCNRIEDKQIQSYINKKAHMLRNESKKSTILASLGYISDFEGCWCIVLNAGKGDTFTIKLQKVKMLSHVDDFEYDLEKLEQNDIPATLCAIIENHTDEYVFRNMPGYIWIDNPSGVIPERAFSNDPDIKYVEMSDNINKIDFDAFANCANLESVRIGRAVEEISSRAFSNCCNLKSVSISASVKVVGGGSFEDCPHLSDVLFEGESRCEVIEASAFSNCESLDSIIIPRSTKKIGEKAFSDCLSLTNVSFENQSLCSAICSRAFSGCVSLSDINVPDVALIFENVFEKCDRLREKYLSQNTDDVVAHAIFKNLTEAEYREKFNCESTYRGISICGLKTQDCVVEIPSTIGRFEVEKIGKNAFANSNITEITIPATVYEIADSAFDNCQKLKRVYFNATVDWFGNWFNNCTELSELVISKKIKGITYNALSGCVNLCKISVDPQNKYLTVVDNVLYSDNGKTLLRYLPGIEQTVFKVPEGVTKIADGAFARCKKLKEVILSNDIDKIESCAFEGCVSLESIKIPASVKFVSFHVFRECDKLTIYLDPGCQTEKWGGLWNSDERPIVAK